MDTKRQTAFDAYMKASEAMGLDLDFERIDLDRMNRATPGITWTSFGGACPLQGEGTFDETGEDAYFRFRHDNARLEIGRFPLKREDRGRSWDTRLHAWKGNVLGNVWSGDMTNDQLEPVLVELYGNLCQPGPGETYQEKMRSAVQKLGERMDRRKGESS